MMKQFSRRPGRQSGAALLILMGMILMGAMYAMLSNSNRMRFNSKTVQDQQIAIKELHDAKTALLGRASGDNNRPGSLSCPDTDNDGNTDTYPSGQCYDYLGRLPWRTLGLKPSTGHDQLWYALSPNFHDEETVQPLNVNSLAQLSVNGEDNVVAVIIAPGAPTGGQERDAGGSASNSPEDYLDSAHVSDPLSGSASYFTDGRDNDLVIAITHDEIAKVMQERIAGEVLGFLREYRQDPNKGNGYYPWLANFDNPDNNSSFIPQVGTNKGLLPYEAEDEWFPTDLSLDWNVPNSGTVILDTSSPATVTENDLRQFVLSATAGDGMECRSVTDENLGHVKCRGTIIQIVGLPSSVEKREYSFDLDFNGDSPVPQSPTVARPGTRGEIKLENSSLQANHSDPVLTIKDYNTGGDRVGQGELTLDSSGAGGDYIEINDIFYNPRVPTWFVDNEWHKLVYVAYSAQYAPGADLTIPCDDPGASANCLEVSSISDASVIHEKQRVVVIVAGAALDTQDRVTYPELLSSYFEGDNADSDDIFEISPVNGSFNDRVRSQHIDWSL